MEQKIFGMTSNWYGWHRRRRVCCGMLSCVRCVTRRWRRAPRFQTKSEPLLMHSALLMLTVTVCMHLHDCVYLCDCVCIYMTVYECINVFVCLCMNNVFV